MEKKRANDPFAPFVKTHPILESEKLVLELVNGFHQPVQVKAIFLRDGDSPQSLLKEQKELVPGRISVDRCHRNIAGVVFGRDFRAREKS